MAETAVPMRIEEKALARIEELGMRHQFEQMLAHVQRTAPGLRGIRVELEYDPVCPQNDPQVVIYVHRAEPLDKKALDPTTWDWIAWRVRTFGPEVCLQIQMEPVFGGPDGW